jgi:hypothetical protein
MPFDSNGVFTRVMNWTSDQQNGIAIECGRHDQEDDNFAEGFNNTFCRDGRAAATGDFNLGQHKITNLANGIASTDAVTKGQLDSVNSTLTASTVNLTSAQTISGAKTFSSAVTFANNTWNPVGDDAYFGDSNLSGAFCIKGNNASSKIALFDRNSSYNNGFYIDESDGNALKLINPTHGANSWGSVTAMVASNLITANKGYVKFNHGLIIQWGRVGTGENFSVTFPTPFSSSASYGIAVAPLYDNGTDAYALNVKYRTNTGFTGYLNANYNGASYIAIGY